ncbi:hypothetical protein D910_02698 [Dendroctonus ponderosae]|uniref:Uncharacterized protein n=2 Tax=Dendroctonus ponderosae TaxID=77166 RepID=U4TWT6_DENPD|nr:hypothetical protein D910_02698 [Dendroctonus ponderosae]
MVPYMYQGPLYVPCACVITVNPNGVVIFIVTLPIVKERCCDVECLDPPGDLAAKMLQEHRRRKWRSSAGHQKFVSSTLFLVLVVLRALL